jgi:hypothetical protein
MLAGALSGKATVAVALGVAQLVAGITGPLGSPIDAIGKVTSNHTPIPVKELAITDSDNRPAGDGDVPTADVLTANATGYIISSVLMPKPQAPNPRAWGVGLVPGWCRRA